MRGAFVELLAAGVEVPGYLDSTAKAGNMLANPFGEREDDSESDEEFEDSDDSAGSDDQTASPQMGARARQQRQSIQQCDSRRRAP